MNNSDQLILFSEDLAVLLNAGSDLDSSLEFMVNARRGTPLEAVLVELRSRVRNGVLLSRALAEQADYFDNYFVGMVRSGEASGQLASALAQLAKQLENNQELKSQINNALIYPTILIAVMALSLMLVLGVILPKLTSLFGSFGGELSLAAQALLATGNFINRWGQTILIITSALIILAYLLQEPLQTKQRAISLVRRVPFVRRLLSQIEFARFTSTLSSLLSSGLSQVDALSIAAESFQYADSRDQIEIAIVKIKDGKSLSHAMESVDGLGHLYAHSIESGERAGQLPETLNVLAQRLERDFSRRAKRLASMVEPLLVVVLGLVIGLIVVTVFSALQSMGDLPL